MNPCNLSESISWWYVFRSGTFKKFIYFDSKKKSHGHIYTKQVLGSFHITLVARIHLPKQNVCIGNYR